MPGLAGGPRPAGATSPASSLTLTSQTSWVHDSTGITLGLAVTSDLPASDLEVDVTLYSQLHSRVGFEDTVKGGLDGLAALSRVTLPLESLLGAGHSSGQASVQLPVSAPGVPTGKVPKSIPSSQYLQLSCTLGACDGVYPLQVSLVHSATASALATFTTHLILVPSAVVPSPLRFSFVVPIGSSPAFSPTGEQIPSGAASALASIEASITATPGAPLTLAASPQALEAMAAPGKDARATLLSGLGAAIEAGDASLTDAPFAAVDPSGLTATGAGNELAAQFHRGRDAMSELPKSISGVPPSSTYVSESWLSHSALLAVQQTGVQRVVLPDSNVGLPDAWSDTVTAPFHVSGASVEVASSDSALASHLAGTGGAVLRAHQLLADLAEIYFGYPNAPVARGVVLVAPSSWSPDHVFLGELMRGLVSSPIVDTVSLAHYFSSVPVGSCSAPDGLGCSPSTLQLDAPTVPADNLVPAAAVVGARSTLGEVAAIEPTAGALLDQLSDGVLVGQTAGLGASERAGYFAAPSAALHGIGTTLSLSTGRTVTVTSHSARVPISVTSSAPGPVHVLLTISSPDLTVPPDVRAIPMVLTHGVNVTIIHLNAPPSGDSTLELQLRSPSGATLLASGALTLRSTQISGVAIALTIGAAAFLLIWWGRSVLRRGRKRAGKHAKRHRRGRGHAHEEPPAP